MGEIMSDTCAAISRFVARCVQLETLRRGNIAAGKYKTGYHPEDERPDLHTAVLGNMEKCDKKLRELINKSEAGFVAMGCKMSDFFDEAHRTELAVHNLLTWAVCMAPASTLEEAANKAKSFLETKIRDAQEGVERMQYLEPRYSTYP